MLLYLPAYSPDLNPIEESFSTCKFDYLPLTDSETATDHLTRESISSP